MKKLIRIRVVQFFLYDHRDVEVGNSCGIFGANGSGKSSLLDAVQIVMLGANESRGSAGVVFNAQADESNHNSRNIRSYCLGQYGDLPEARARDNANTYITLVWQDTETQEFVSTGVCIHASADREKADVLGRYIIPVDITLNDHLEMVDGEPSSPRPWSSFRQMLSQRAHGEEVLFHDSERFVSALLLRLRGARRAPRLEAYRQAFRFGLRMKFDKSVDDIVRAQVLETRPTNIKRFKEVLHTFQEMAILVRNVQAKLDEAELIENDFADAHRRTSHSVCLTALAHAAELEVANEAVVDAETAEGRGQSALQTAIDTREQTTRQFEAAEAEARERASERDTHASHTDAALLRENLKGVQTRLTAQKVGPHRTITAIGRAIDAQIPGKLVANSAEATELAFKDIHALLGGERAGNRDAVESTVHQARSAGGKQPLEGPALSLQRALAKAGVDATPVCDLVRIDDPQWQSVIESYLGVSNMQALMVDERDEHDAFRVSRKESIYEAKVVMPSKFANRPSPQRGAVAELISGHSVAAVNYLRAKFGDTQRAETEDECFAHKYAMTKDGMLLIDGELVRKRPTPPDAFKIGPVSTTTRSSIAERERQLKADIARLQDQYDKLKQLLVTLGPFAGNEQEKVQEILEAFDRVAIETAAEKDLTERLQALNTDDYRRLVQAATGAEAAVTALRPRHLDTVEAVGSAQRNCEQLALATQKARQWTVSRREIADGARAAEGFDADYAADQWERMLDRQGLSYREIVDSCFSRSKGAREDARTKSTNGLSKLSAFLVRHNEFAPHGTLEDWRAARAWLRVGARATHATRAPQMLQQLLLQGAARLNEQAAVDRLVRHMKARVGRISMLEPAGDLLWRPQHPEHVLHDASQRPVLGQFAALRPKSAFPCRLVRQSRPITVLAAVATDFPADRRRLPF